MNIYIKSFNRPYYLDRCINSIYRNIKGFTKIIILDDGTHPKYLKKLNEIFPELEIRFSSYYNEKVQAIENHIANPNIPIRKLRIPTKFWKENIISNEDEYFVLLEDDMWFTSEINLSTTHQSCIENNIKLLRFTSFGNPSLKSGDLYPFDKFLYNVKPNFYTTNNFIFHHIVLYNTLKISSILLRLKLYSLKYWVEYYTIYSVAGVIFSKDYYAAIWGDVNNHVNERLQLKKALKYYKKNINNANYAVTQKDIINTSFTSSATNMFRGINLDVFICNYLLNEAWFKNDLNPNKGYPDDISSFEIKKILEFYNNEFATVGEWEKWSNAFKSQYRNAGHNI